MSEQTAFFELSKSLNEKFSVTGGARFSHVSFEGVATGPRMSGPEAGRIEGSDWVLLPSLALSFKPRPDAILYLRYQESFRPGGVIVQTNATQQMDSDRLAGLEIGIRAGTRSAGVSGAASISYSRWTDIQADMIDLTGFPSTTNLGDGHIQSLDVRFSWRATPKLRLGFASVLSRSRVSNPKPGIIFIDKIPLPGVPDVTATASFEYSLPLSRVGDLQLSGRARYIGESMLGIGPTLGRKQGQYLDTALEAHLVRGSLDTFLAATNLLDRVGNRFALGSVLTVDRDDQVTPLRPRSVRIGIVRRF